tara:strand:+ start:1446 stop:1610 length:165 start_codon:yes stop_codon:yes gene_type:complete
MEDKPKAKRTKAEWITIASHCFHAHLIAPKYSPMRLLFSWGEKYAIKKAAQSPE